MDTDIPVRPTIVLALRNASAFLEVFFNQGAVGGVLAPNDDRIQVGDEVDLELVFVAEKLSFHSRGIARWRRVAAKPGLPAGLGIDFFPSERRTRDLLLDFARGKSVTLYQRLNRRFPVSIVVEYESGSVFLTDVTDNLSRDGAFVRSERPPPVGTRLRMKLKPPGDRKGIELDATVIWLRLEGHPGFGVHFDTHRRGVRKRLEQLIERVKRQIAAGA